MKIITAFAALLLCGCATVFEQVDTVDFRANQGDGYIIVSFIEKDMDKDIRRYPRFQVKSVQGESTGIISSFDGQSSNNLMRRKAAKASDFDDRLGTVVVMKAKAGNYTTANIEIPIDGYRTLVFENMTPVNFRVIAGKIIYIGNFDFTFRSEDGGIFIDEILPQKITLKNNADEDISIAKRKYPFLDNQAIEIEVTETVLF